MAPAPKLVWIILILLSMVAPLAAVTTPADVRKALDNVASYRGESEAPGAFSPVLAERLQLLRRRARDFAFGSVAEAARTARERDDLIAKARQRTRRAGMPLKSKSAWLPDQFSPSVRIQFFPIPETPSWIGARVYVGIPCGEDVSLYLWKLSGDQESNGLAPELTLARESPLTDLATSTGTLHFAAKLDGDEGAPQLATFETGVWCNSQWRKALVQVVRGSDHPYRPERLFTHHELAFLAGEQEAAVERTETGFLFRYRGQFWLDPQQHSRPKQLEVRIQGDRAHILPPREDDPVLFLDQWLSQPWTRSREWTTGRNLVALRAWHDTLSPDSDARLTTELLGQGGCVADPKTYFVHLHTDHPVAGQPVAGKDVYGILRLQEDGLRVEHITAELPANCGVTASPAPRQVN
ncbi:MAG: hypothetical protein KIT83_14320 [Bryobacterales bacterium]|nr:hypothetical protein [Bryobacterales bacterium]